ncbi:MAG: HDOD domain-containing protein [Thiohalomonadaceae bacterium]
MLRWFFASWTASRRASPAPATAQTASAATPPRAPMVPLCNPRELAYAFNGLLLGVHPEEVDGGEAPTLTAVERRVQAEVQTLLARGLSAADVPRLPASVPQLLESLEQQRHAREIASLINRDPALAAELVHLANSPVFRRSREPVRTVEAAFLYVGEDGIRALLVACAMRPAFAIKPVYFRLFGRLLWQHALDCAHACQVFGRRTVGDPAVAFFTGLIHDLGKLVVFQRTLAVFCAEAPVEPLRPVVFQHLIEQFAARLTVEICGRWNIPEEVSDAIAQQSDRPAADMSALARALFIGDAVAETHMLLTERAVRRSRLMEHLRSHGIPWLRLYEAFPEHREGRDGLETTSGQLQWKP